MYLKRFLLLLILGFSITLLKAQDINFFQGNMDEAKALARKQHKLIYVLMELGTDDLRISPAQKDPKLVSLYNSNFICIYKSHTQREGFQSLYYKNNVKSYPTHLFLDEEGGLVLKTVGSRSSKEPYIADINNAKQLAKQKTLTKFKAEYDKGARGLAFLKNYLSKYNELDIPVNQLLLEEYVNLLPVSALDDYQTVLFIMELGPVLSTKAYKVSRMNTKITDSIYKTLPLDRRMKMNNRIIEYSLAQAVRRKDERLAGLTANFVSASWGNDWLKASSGRSEKMMEYYKAVRDTANYLRNAAEYYQSYYLTQRDSIHKPEPVNEMMAKLPKPAPIKRDSVKTGKRIVRTFRISSLSGRMGDVNMDAKNAQRFKAVEFATTLNNGAYSFYTMGSTNLAYLGRAVVWVQRSIELFPDRSAFYDTLSHLYYRQGKCEEAIATQQKAIDVHNELAKKSAEMRAKLNYTSPLPDYNAGILEKLVAELDKMKSKTL